MNSSQSKIYIFLTEPGHGLALAAHIILFAILFMVVGRVGKKILNRRGAMNLMVFTASLLISLFIAELALRMLGTFSTYLENKNGRYTSIRKYLPSEGILKHAPLTTVTFQSPGEFEYSIQTNELGYSDLSWKNAPKDSTLNILVLGDSFTEGYGAPQDSSWVALARQYDIGRPAIWFNAGISAADPFFNYKALEKELYKMRPDIVLQVISSQDFRDDLAIRGGMERFAPDGKVRYPPQRKGEMLYAYSHLSRFWFRIVLGLNESLTDEKQANGTNETTLGHFASLDQLYGQWAERHGAKVFYVFFPQLWGESMDSSYNADILNHILQTERSIPIIDLLPCYRAYYLREQEAFQQRWWPADGHHNSAGYQMMAECLAARLKEHLASDVAVTK